jgi:hypothetical protein
MRVRLSEIRDVYVHIRQGYDRAQVESLADLLASDPHFDLPPVILIRPGRGDGYLLVSGFHRLQAYRLAGREDIPAAIASSENEALVAAISDNAIGVVPLSKSERRRAAHQLLRAGLSVDDVAQLVGASPAWVRRVQGEIEAEKMEKAQPALVHADQDQPAQQPAQPEKPKKQKIEHRKRDKGTIVSKLAAPQQSIFLGLHGPTIALLHLLRSFDTKLGAVISELHKIHGLDLYDGERRQAAADYATVRGYFNDIITLFKNIFSKMKQINEIVEGWNSDGSS